MSNKISTEDFGHDFGHERSAAACRARAAWEREEAERCAYHAARNPGLGSEHTAAAHRRTADEYDRLAERYERGELIPPSWGLPASVIPQGSRLAWGGRAIYRLTDERKRHGKGWRAVTVAEIDLPWDRQDTRAVEGVPDAERAAFAKWINRAGLPALRKKLAADYITTDSDETVTFASDGFAIAASPRGSYGHLYITAWRVERGHVDDDDSPNPNDHESARRDRGLPARDGTTRGR